MKYQLFLLISLIPTVSYGQHPTDRPAFSAEFSKNTYLNNWLNYSEDFALNDFTYSSTVAFEGTFQDTIVRHGQTFKDYQKTYGPLISYAPDSSYFLDFYSDEIAIKDSAGRYSLFRGVDQTLLLGDLKSAKIIRIAFLGSSKRVEEAAWINDNEFICVGTSYDGQYYLPFIYLGNLSDGGYHVFLPRKHGVHRTKKYISPKWNSVNVDRAAL